MGLLAVGISAASSVLSDQWRDYFYCDALSEDTLAVKGHRRATRRSNHGDDNIITNGSIIAVNEGQCMLIVEQGAIVECCAQAGEFLFDSSTEPSIFFGGLSNGIKDSFETFKKRVAFGGETGNDQRIYFINTKEIIGNKYGTANPVPFRVIDKNIGLDVDISIACHGEYSYRITDPILFYKNVCGNITTAYTRDRIDAQLKSELLTALQPAFAKISAQGVRYSEVPGHTTELADALDAELDEKWKKTRGIELESIGVSSMRASEEDEKMIKDLQKSAVYRNPTMAAANLSAAQADAMRSAASNTSTGPMMAFAGMNMAQQQGGMNAQQLYQMGAAQQAQQNAQQQAPAGAWTCPKCGQQNTGKFCSNCGTKKPESDVWYCPNCGTQNTGKFCTNCGTKRP